MAAWDRATLIRKSWIFILAFLIAGYALFQGRFLIFGPSLYLETPLANHAYETSFIEVSGYAENAAKLWLNDRPIFMDEQGRFEERLLLAYGYNIITVKAEDRFGRSEREIIGVVYK